MGVTYLVPTLNRPSLWDMVRDFRRFAAPGDELRMSTAKGMTHALREAFQYSTTEVVRNCADDDAYPPEANRKAVEIMEASDIDVLVTGGIKELKEGTLAVCVPKGANYGASVDDVAKYGACGSGLFMRRSAVEKYGLLDYEGWRIDNFIVLKAIASGAKVRFCRLNTYRHKISLGDPGEAVRKDHQREKAALFHHFGVRGQHQPYEDPPVWDGEFA